jgi:hypothetical protein
MKTNLTRVLLASVAAALVIAAPASAKTYAVAGKQIAVNENAGKYRMTGGLIGKWKTTSFKQLATSPIYKAKGTEKFNGCLDRRRDGHCAGDPRGTLSFRFLYWALFGPGDSLVWGSCWHPITGGTGGFAGARGVLTFVDTPTAKGVKTAYVGNVTVGESRHGRSAARRATASGSHACGQS